MKIKVMKTASWAVLPAYATDGSGCFDLSGAVKDYTPSGRLEADAEDPRTLMANGVVFDTGLKFEIPKGYAMLLYSRSGHGFKHDIRLVNSVGVIDSDYRGNVMVKLRADSLEGKLQLGTMVEGALGHALSQYDPNAVMEAPTLHRIAQAMIVPIPEVTFEEATELSDTERGEGGFGSTGA